MNERLRNIVDGLVLWTPPSDELHLADGSGGGAQVLEFPLLVPIDLTESHGIDITAQRLEEIIAAYDPAVENASLNFDHTWGGPSLGWCERTWLQDGSLWVRYVDLSQDAIDGVRTRAYTRRSAEIALSHPVTKGWYLTGTALLGNKRPAIPGLPPVTLCRPQYVLTSQEKKPVTDPAPTNPPAPAPADPAAAAHLANLERQVGEGTVALAAILRQNAELTTDREIAALGARLTPAMAKLARPLLVELFASRTPLTVRLQDDPQTTPAEVAVSARLLAILAAAPQVEALSGRRLAEEPPAALAAASGLTPERLAELNARYQFQTNAFGFRPPGN